MGKANNRRQAQHSSGFHGTHHGRERLPKSMRKKARNADRRRRAADEVAAEAAELEAMVSEQDQSSVPQSGGAELPARRGPHPYCLPDKCTIGSPTCPKKADKSDIEGPALIAPEPAAELDPIALALRCPDIPRNALSSQKEMGHGRSLIRQGYHVSHAMRVTQCGFDWFSDLIDGSGYSKELGDDGSDGDRDDRVGSPSGGHLALVAR